MGRLDMKNILEWFSNTIDKFRWQIYYNKSTKRYRIGHTVWCKVKSHGDHVGDYCRLCGRFPPEKLIRKVNFLNKLTKL
jgi:hypothetical protein